MKKIFALLFLALFIAGAFGAPAVPEIIVNNSTMQCSEFFSGDECMYCSPPEGWESIGFLFDFETDCPFGYKWIDLEFSEWNCSLSKDEFCCSYGHSGAWGDCEDVVVNILAFQCAFVEDIEKCKSLPFGWTRAAVTEDYGRVCQFFDDSWLEEELECELKEEIDAGKKPIPPKKDGIPENPETGFDSVIIACAVIIGFLIIGIGGFLFVTVFILPGYNQ